jgi:hypothetical protein
MVALLLVLILVVGSNGERESKSNRDELLELHFEWVTNE